MQHAVISRILSNNATLAPAVNILRSIEGSLHTKELPCIIISSGSITTHILHAYTSGQNKEMYSQHHLSLRAEFNYSHNFKIV